MFIGPRFNHNTYRFRYTHENYRDMVAHERMIGKYRFIFSTLTRTDGTVSYLVTKKGHGYLNTTTHVIFR